MDNWSDLPRYITYTDVCRMLGITRVTLDAYVKRGTFIKPIRVGKTIWRFDKYKVMLYMKGMGIDEIEAMTEEELEKSASGSK